MHGNRRNVLGKVRRRAKTMRARVPYGVAVSFSVGSVPAFKAAHALAGVMADPRHRARIRLKAGTYRMTVECTAGVDLVGEQGTVIEWGGPRDTVDLNGADARLRGLTICHFGPDFYYAIHADSPGPGGALLEDLEVYADSKSALGIGMQPGQSLTVRRCHFERGDQGLLSEPVLAHNSHLGHDGPLVFEACTAHSATGGRVSVWTDAITGEVSELLGIETAPARFAPRV